MIGLGGMKTLSIDLRERILASYDAHEGTRDEIANRYRVSLGMVKKLLQQRRKTGDIGPATSFLRAQAQRSGSAPRDGSGSCCPGRPDLTLAELREAAALSCSLPAIHPTCSGR